MIGYRHTKIKRSVQRRHQQMTKSVSCAREEVHLYHKSAQSRKSCWLSSATVLSRLQIHSTVMLSTISLLVWEIYTFSSLPYDNLDKLQTCILFHSCFCQPVSSLRLSQSFCLSLNIIVPWNLYVVLVWHCTDCYLACCFLRCGLCTWRMGRVGCWLLHRHDIWSHHSS